MDEYTRFEPASKLLEWKGRSPKAMKTESWKGAQELRQSVGKTSGERILPHALYSNSSMTISGLEPRRSGGPQVPAPLEVNTCIFPMRLRPYTN